MSAYTHGSPTFSGVTLTGARLISDQANGPVWEYTYEGTQSAIATQAGISQSAGARTVIDDSSPINRLVATYVRDPNASVGSETPTDVFSIDWEENQVSLFSSPRAIEEAAGYVSVAQYKSDIMDAAQAGDAFPLDQASYPVAFYLYNLIAQGIDTFPVSSPFLRRNRTYSLTYTGTPYRVTYGAIVYTRAALITLLGITSPLTERIPLDPEETLPEGFVWGWYLAQQSYSYQRERGGVKVTETLGFRFGKWNAWPSSSAIQGLYTLIE